MTLQDVHLLDASLAGTLSQLAGVARRRRQLESDRALSAEQRRAAIEALGVDGCSVEDLGLDFTLPGHPSIELKKGGRDEPVTIHNLDQYLKVGASWACGKLFESLNQFHGRLIVIANISKHRKFSSSSSSDCLITVFSSIVT